MARKSGAEFATTDSGVSIKPLDETAAKIWDRYRKNEERCKTANKWKADKDDAKTEFLELMGDANLARLPDGRIVCRRLKSANKRAQPARTDEWFELSELAQ